VVDCMYAHIIHALLTSFSWQVEIIVENVINMLGTAHRIALYSIIKFDKSNVNAVKRRNSLIDAKTAHEALPQNLGRTIRIVVSAVPPCGACGGAIGPPATSAKTRIL
jgi:hypothetical protein